MSTPVSPLANALPELPPLAGVTLGAAAVGIRYQGRTDVVMMEVSPGSAVAGVFTSNKCPGAPVDWCRGALKGRKARLLVVNAGNANVFTGLAGRRTCEATAEAAAALVGCPARQVFVASTGVIGEVLPHEKLVAALPALRKTLREDGWEAAARGIMTTDTFPKASSHTALIDGHEVRITGIAKGSGMIAPDMATMLCFIFTDAKIPAAVLQKLLKQGVDRSFNCTTVDSDTSTSDTVLLIATGETKHPRVPAEGGAMLRDFARVGCGADGPGAGGGAGRGGRTEVGAHRRDGRGERSVRQAGGDGGGQLAAGEDGDRRGRRQLGADRDGGWQGG
jgi:glutamate N-acetyltransferase/amino-acid N-acetyltransferase